MIWYLDEFLWLLGGFLTWGCWPKVKPTDLQGLERCGSHSTRCFDGFLGLLGECLAFQLLAPLSATPRDGKLDVTILASRHEGQPCKFPWCVWQVCLRTFWRQHQILGGRRVRISMYMFTHPNLYSRYKCKSIYTYIYTHCMLMTHLCFER